MGPFSGPIFLKRDFCFYLKIFRWIPVVFHKYDSVCSGEVETESSDVCRQEQNIDARIIVEPRMSTRMHKCIVVSQM